MASLVNKRLIKCLIILVIIYYSCFLSQKLWIGRDNVAYIILARSLAQGNGYIDHFLAEPKINYRLPPGFPFLLSLVIRIFGENFLLFRILTIFLFGLSFFVLLNIMSKYLPEKEIMLTFLIFALNPFFLNFAHAISSDSAYFLFSWLGILFFLNNENTLSIKKLGFIALLIIIAFYIRGIGISLYLALVIYLLLKNKYRQAFFVVLMGILILPWAINVLLKQAGYVNIFWMKNVYEPSLGTIKISDIPFRLFFNFRYYAAKVIADLLFFPYFKEVTFGNPNFAIKIILSLLFSFLFLNGFYLSAKNRLGLIEIYVFIYFFLILFWTYHSEHLILAIYPFLIGYLFISLRQVKLKFLKGVVIVGLLITMPLPNYNAFKRLFNKKDVLDPYLSKGFAWLRANTSPEAVIISEDPAGVYFYTGRKGFLFELRSDHSESLEFIKQKKIHFLMLRKDSHFVIRGKKVFNFDKFVRPLIDKYPAYFKLVYQDSDGPGIMIYKIDTLS